MRYSYALSSPLGGITLASDGEKLTGLWFDGQKYFGAGLSPHAERRTLPVFMQTQEWLGVYFSGKAPDFTPPLSLEEGSPFFRRVQKILLSIPFGKTMTYGEIAEKIARETGKAVSARAVGGAIGHNRISLIVPCHRVLGAGGKLTGYAAGTDIKRALLKTEGIICT